MTNINTLHRIALDYEPGASIPLNRDLVLAMCEAIEAAKALVDSFDPISRTDAREALRQALQPFAEQK